MAPPGGQARLKPHASGARSVPAVVFDHVVEFNDVLPLLVFLAALKGLLLKGERGLPVTDQTSTMRQWGLAMQIIGLVLCMKKLWPREAQYGKRENFGPWVFLKFDGSSNGEHMEVPRRFHSPGITKLRAISTYR